MKKTVCDFDIFKVKFLLLISIAVFFFTSYCPAAENDDMISLDLEDLMDIHVTSVSKKSQSISEAAAAIFVITQEDIRRSGATCIPEALRMVPGIQVAKVAANKWAITTRGSNGIFANKLLVLMDGRNVYTPLYSGVYWENIDAVMEDIDRIEVIRGPGASLWGANAVNGVINIITKAADETQGVLISAIAGSEEKGNLSLRYGEKMGINTPFRVYIKGFERDSALDADGNDMKDDWRYLRGGFRLDHQHGARDFFTLQGDIFKGSIGETINAPTLNPPYTDTYDYDHQEKGLNVLTRWTRTVSSLSEMSLQVYYDHTKHIQHVGTDDADTIDLEFQHRFPLGEFHDVTWGLGYRFYTYDFKDEPPLAVVTPLSENLSTFNAFFQDEVSFFNKRLRLTLGSKFEYNEYTHFEIQPNARLLWKPNDRHSLWASISRAVRIPSRMERYSQALLAVSTEMGYPIAINFSGSEDFGSEELIAYEMGYRVKATQNLSLDATIFYNDYDKLRTTIVSAPEPPAYSTISITATNETDGCVYGFELIADWRPVEWLHFQPAYTYMENSINFNENDTVSAMDPRHQFSLRTAINFPKNIALDLWYRVVDEVSETIGGYHTLDARLGWEYNNNLEFSIVGQNLIDSHHPEMVAEAMYYASTEVQRAVYAKVVWKFD